MRFFGGVDPFREGLRDLGYVDGKTVQVESRFADGREDRLPGLAAELVAINVDVIATYATGVYAAHDATATIPIVMATGGDLVAMGLAESLAHPGGNVTGVTFFVVQLMAKRLELLKAVAPSLARAGVLLLKDMPAKSKTDLLTTMGAAAKALNVELDTIEVRELGDLEPTIARAVDGGLEGLVVLDHAFFTANAAAIAALAARRRLLSAGALEFGRAGGLIGYGVNFPELFRRAAGIVDRILKGAKPGDIPIEQATKFHMIVNLKTAEALGLDVPPTLLAGADEVIE
jgi:putative tryptophan/tyrosine transport system substrate-binding protein